MGNAWSAALFRGRELMQIEASQHSFEIYNEDWLYYDARNGERKAVWLPSGGAMAIL
jgi:hypothetical protein